MKLVQKSLTKCASVLCGMLVAVSVASIAQAPSNLPYSAYYNPAKGFKPAQTSLTQVFLQLAGSLEHHGSPEPYIRHMQAEHKRVSALFEQKTGNPSREILPAHMSDKYLDRFIANWNLLSSRLRLDQLAKEAGIATRKALRGDGGGNGTLLVEALNRHQEEVVNAMQGKGNKGSFAQLQATVAEVLSLSAKNGESTGTPLTAPALDVLVEREKALSGAEKKEYAALIKHVRFSKAEFAALDRFYKAAYDKLSEEGKAEMSKRIWDGTRNGMSMPQVHDAFTFAQDFFNQKARLFQRLDTTVSPEQAKQLKDMVNSFFLDIGQLAHSELKIGMIDWAFK